MMLVKANKEFEATKEIGPLTGGFPFRDYFIEVRPPYTEEFLDSVEGFLHGDSGTQIAEEYWSKAGMIVLLRPGETHKATMHSPGTYWDS
jgi:hypothetical protein